MRERERIVRANSRVIVVYACVCIINAYVKLSQPNCLKWMKASYKTRFESKSLTKNPQSFKNRLENCIFVLGFSNVKSFFKLEQNTPKLCELSLLNQVNESDILFFSCLTYVSVICVCVFVWNIGFIDISHYNSGSNLILICSEKLKNDLKLMSENRVAYGNSWELGGGGVFMAFSQHNEEYLWFFSSIFLIIATFFYFVIVYSLQQLRDAININNKSKINILSVNIPRL